jgi:alpha-tubulin suppressor-like RCC1 family protein
MSLVGGDYVSEQTLVITCSTPGATIHYTVGSSLSQTTEPTEADPVIASGGSILIDRSMGVSLQAFKPGLTPSGWVGDEFRITGQLAAGGNHTVALKSNGDVWAWGSNTNGEIGDGTTGTGPRAIPTRVRINASTFLTSVKSIAAGTNHTVALKSDGTVVAWGLNSSGQLGDATTVQKVFPVTVKLANGTPLSGITQIACGATHSLALKSDGTVWAWGANGSGRLGDGGTTNRLVATQVKTNTSTFLTGVVSIAAGAAHSAAAKSNNTVWCWGLNSSGQLGNNTTKASSFPVQVVTSAGPLEGNRVFCGANHTFGLVGTELYGWGLNSNGQLSDGTTTSPRKVAVQSVSPASPPFVPNPIPVTGVTKVAGGNAHTAAIMAGNGWNGYYSQIYTWGLNTSGQLGIGSTSQRTYPVPPSLFDVPPTGDVVAGASYTVACLLDGAVWAWGSNNAGQLAQSNTSTTYLNPTKIAGFVIVYGMDDPDGDGLPTWRERELATNPFVSDTDGDGMPDGWEANHGLNPNGNDASVDADGDGLTNLQEYQGATDPQDYYNGISSFNFDLASGDSQFGPASAWLTQPLVVRVTNASGVPMVNAPVKFSLGQSEGGLSDTNGGSASAFVTIRTDSSGTAAAYYRQPAANDASSRVNAETGTATVKQVTFRASTADIPGAGLKLWLNTETGIDVAPNMPVTTWVDQSAARNSAVQGAGFSPPLLRPNIVSGKPVVRFGTANSLLNGGALVSGTDCSIFAVVSPDGVATGPVLSRPANYYLGTGAGGNFTTLYGNGTAWNDSQPHGVHLPAGQFNILESINNGTDSAYLNGLLVESRPSPMTATTGGYVLGGSWTGDVAEILVYDRALSDTERVIVENYLNRRYGCIPSAPTAVPANFSVSSGLPGLATIQWDAKNLVSYVIERKTGPNGTWAVIATVESGGVYEDTDLTSGTQYFYRIRATHFTGQSPYSAEIAVTPPSPVIPTATLDRIATGFWSASLVLQGTGTVQTWGYYPGDGTTQPRNNPVPLSAAAGTISVAAGDNHAVILKSNGTVWAWGNNGEGQLGSGAVDVTRYVPTQVPNLTDIVSVKVGYGHTLALRQNGTILAWGDNYNGALGNGFRGDAYDSNVPVAVTTLTNVKQIAAGGFSSFALTADGKVWQWGYRYTNTPVQVPDLNHVVAIAAGDNHALAVRMDGTVWAWGPDNYGVLGNGSSAITYTPVPMRVLNISSAVAIASLHNSNLALLQDGTVFAWGRNYDGELGLGSPIGEQQEPVRIPGLSNVVAICTGWAQSMAMLANGAVFAWGDPYNGQGETPQQVPLGFVDSNSNGMDDAWELNYFGSLNELPSGDYDGDGLTNVAEYSGQTNPTDYYNGTLPTVTVVSGNNQSADPDAFLAAPLVVHVANSQGQPLANAPVTFSTSADGRFSTTNDGTGALVYSISTRTDSGGLASTYFKTPPLLNATMTISAMALTETGPSTATFTAETNDLPLPDAPSNVMAELQADGTTLISWSAATGVGHGFAIKYQNNDGSWSDLGTVPASARSATIPANSGPYVNTSNYVVDLLYYDRTVTSNQSNPSPVRYAVIDLQKDLTLPYYLEPLYLTNSGYLLLWDAEYSYLWHNGQLTDNGRFRDDMDVLEDGTVVPMPIHDNLDNPIQVWKTRNGVSIGGGFYALGMKGMNKVNGQLMPFDALDINSNGTVLAFDGTGVFFYGPPFPSQPSYLPPVFYPYTLNHHTITVTDASGNPTQRVSPQVVGRGLSGAVLAEEDPGSGQYKIDYLNRRIPPNSGWDLTSAWSINDLGMITAVGSYQANPVAPIQEKACLLVPGVFEARPGKIDDGFDPMGSEPWASVGVGGTNEAVQFTTAPALASRVSFSVASGASFVTVSHEVKPEGKIHITLSGTSAGSAVVEAKLDGQVIVGRLNVLVLPIRNLRVAIYRVEDSRFSQTAIPPNPALDQSIIETLNDVFKQACITFELEISDYRNWPFDSNGDGICTRAEWQNSRPDNANGLGGQIRAFLIKEGEPGWGGFSVNKSHPTSPTPGPGGVIFLHSPPDRIQIHAAHEFGHGLELPVVDTHDPGPYPPGTSGLMAPGEAAAPPGKWLRHQDWERCNTEAGGL